MRVYLCEKPSQGRDIARVLGAVRKSEGCLLGDGVIVTWCFGHLLEQAAPEDYDEKLKRWSLDALPIAPETWKMCVKKDAAAQYKVIQAALKQAKEVVVATDADREGETIAREILERCAWRGPVKRLWLSALDDASIRKALGQMLPGETTEPLYRAGLGRARADWLVGMNLTRLYTLLNQRAGGEGVVSVGRVQTPTLKLVVDRDRAIENFKPVPYFQVVANISTPKGAFLAQWVTPPVLRDPEGRCTSEPAARAVAQKVRGQIGCIVRAETQRKSESAPLPFDLSGLQQEASRRWGMGAQDVLDGAQALYEKHKATTYPRSDCTYLPESQFAEASEILKALAQSDPALAETVKHANAVLKSRAWNDKKITAHHAIIPTAAAVDVNAMSAAELKLYDAIRRRYLAQFYPDLQYDQTTVDAAVCDETFRATGRIVRAPGWKAVLGEESAAKDAAETDNDEDVAQALPPVVPGDAAQVTQAQVKSLMTKPPARYTEGTLIAAMKSIGKTVEDPRLRAVLKETSGIGTEATRAAIIQTLFKRSFIEKKGKKHVISTAAGRGLIDTLPPPVTDPATTARWEQALDEIAQGGGSLQQFMNQQREWVTALVRNRPATGQAFAPTKSPKTASSAARDGEATRLCPQCGQPMRRRNGSKGLFWGCSGYPQCKGTLDDDAGQPKKRRGSTPPPADTNTPSKGSNTALQAGAGKPCPTCKDGRLVQRTVKSGKNEGRKFIGCTNYPRCDHFSWEAVHQVRGPRSGHTVVARGPEPPV